MNAQPKAFGYEKPGDTGQKPWNPGKSKLRIMLPEATKFSDRVSKDFPSELMVTASKLAK